MDQDVIEVYNHIHSSMKNFLIKANDVQENMKVIIQNFEAINTRKDQENFISLTKGTSNSSFSKSINFSFEPSPHFDEQVCALLILG